MKLRSIYVWAAFAFLLFALAGLAYLGTFTRFHADDFCMAADATHIGLVGMLPKWYATWSGRFMFILFSGLFGLGGPGFAGWLPALAEAAWLASLSWAVLPLFKRAGWPYPKRLSVVTGALGLLVLLSSTPNLFQSFFWEAGLITYSLPLIGLTFNCGLILRAWLQPAKTWGSAIGVFLLALVCGGFNEAFIALQVALFALVLCAGLIFGDRSRRRSQLPVLGAALAGGLLAMAIVIAAPGNQVRQGAVGDQPGLVRIVTFSIRNAAFIFGKFFIKTPFWAFLSLSLPFLAGWLFHPAGQDASHLQSSLKWWRQGWLRWLVTVGLTAFVLVTAACAPVVFALNAYPDDRTIIIPQFVITCAVISASALLGTGLRGNKIIPDPRERPAVGRAIRAGMALILLAGVGYATWLTASQSPDFQAYARAWDQRAAVIQQAAAAGEADVTVAGLSARFGLADLNESPDNWVNRCMAYYYDIRNLIGR
jgi:hypothetical protein